LTVTMQPLKSASLIWPKRSSNRPHGHNAKEQSMKHTPSQKVIAAIVANGAGAVNMRQAVRYGMTVRQFKVAMKLHAQVTR